MIQDIRPHIFDNAYGHRRTPQDEDLVLCYEQDEVFSLAKDGLAFPTAGDLRRVCPEAEKNLIFLFRIDEQAFYLWEKEEGHCTHKGRKEESGGICGLFPDGVFLPQMSLRTTGPAELAFAAAEGAMLARWRQNNRFCGRCGSYMEHSGWERAFVCSSCGNTVYPRINPGVIVALVDRDRLVLTRYRDRPYRNLALIAGFTEFGETIQETVVREVREEVGLSAKNIRFFGSQPWPFSDTLLIGFFCELDGDDRISVEEAELSEAAWYRREELEIREDTASLTNTMINAFITGEYREITGLS